MAGRPRVVVTRRLPEAVEARLADLFEAELNAEDGRCRATDWRGRCGRPTGCSAR